MDQGIWPGQAPFDVGSGVSLPSRIAPPSHGGACLHAAAAAAARGEWQHLALARGPRRRGPGTTTAATRHGRDV